MSNLIVGIALSSLGIIIVLVGFWFGKKISPYHVIIYFMASFVLLTGVLLLFLAGEPSIF